MVDLTALEAAYKQASLGGGNRPDYMLIWCDYCRCSHQATLKSNDICVKLRGDIEEAVACRGGMV